MRRKRVCTKVEKSTFSDSGSPHWPQLLVVVFAERALWSAPPSTSSHWVHARPLSETAPGVHAPWSLQPEVSDQLLQSGHPQVVEHVSDTKLAPSHLATLASALRAAAAASPGTGVPRDTEHGWRLPATVFAEVCQRLAVANKLPPAWARASSDTYARIAAAFDTGAAGLVDWRRFVFAVARYSFPALEAPPSVAEVGWPRPACFVCSMHG